MRIKKSQKRKNAEKTTLFKNQENTKKECICLRTMTIMQILRLNGRVREEIRH